MNAPPQAQLSLFDPSQNATLRNPIALLRACNPRPPRPWGSILARRRKAALRAAAGFRAPDFVACFWRRVVMVDDPIACWRWTGKHVRDGYSQVRLPDGKHVGAQRLAWALECRAQLPPAHLVIMHLCDNPDCVRPSHLLLGTHGLNMQDRERKGRGAVEKRRGELCGNSKLTAEEVLAIRDRVGAGATYTELAAEFGVSATNIRSVAIRETWRHVA